MSGREAEFYLEMTGWNVQEALSAFMEVHRDANKILAMSFVMLSCFSERAFSLPSRVNWLRL